MKFTEIQFEKPEIDVLKSYAKELAYQFENAPTFDVQWDVFQTITQFQMNVGTQTTLASIRNSIDTRDKTYDEAVQLINQITPEIEEFNQHFYALFLHARFRPQLEEKLGHFFFDILTLSQKTFAPAIMEDLVIERNLVKSYQDLVASAQILFEGKNRNLPQLGPFMQSKNREIRQNAAKAYFGFFSEHKKEFDGIYDGLVKIRTTIAKKLGYKDFVQLGYDRLGRLDYTSKEVKQYRDQVFRDWVPLCKKLIARQAERIQIKSPKFYDLSLEFLSGNPTPKGNKEWMVDVASKMYHELAPETDQFFTLLKEKELMDLDTKPGKMGGGYCTYLYNQQYPFIFANFNGTQHDVEVLTHEFGHAFQAYQSKDFLVREYMNPTMESAEIHSMSMEFFTHPWMKDFFKEDIDKFTYSHLAGGILFIPYGVTVDEFQHWVYENPEATPDQRHAKWREIEKKYTPYKDYDGIEYLENGGYWVRQLHIFSDPFYYIDYTIAQVLAFQFYVKMKQNYKATWKTYVELCRLGGSLPFTKLLAKTGLEIPFKEGYLQSLLPTLTKELDSINDLAL